MDVALRTDLVGREEPRRRGNSDGVDVRSVGERHDAGTQKLCQPAEQQAEVVAGSGEDGVDAVALGPLEIVAAHAVLGLEMADDRLDSSAALISRRIEAVTRRTWPEIQTLNLCG